MIHHSSSHQLDINMHPSPIWHLPKMSHSLVCLSLDENNHIFFLCLFFANLYLTIILWFSYNLASGYIIKESGKTFRHELLHWALVTFAINKQHFSWKTFFTRIRFQSRIVCLSGTFRSLSVFYVFDQESLEWNNTCSIVYTRNVKLLRFLSLDVWLISCVTTAASSLPVGLTSGTIKHDFLSCRRTIFCQFLSLTWQTWCAKTSGADPVCHPWLMLGKLPAFTTCVAGKR